MSFSLIYRHAACHNKLWKNCNQHSNIRSSGWPTVTFSVVRKSLFSADSLGHLNSENSVAKQQMAKMNSLCSFFRYLHLRLCLGSTTKELIKNRWKRPWVAACWKTSVQGTPRELPSHHKVMNTTSVQTDSSNDHSKHGRAFLSPDNMFIPFQTIFVARSWIIEKLSATSVFPFLHHVLFYVSHRAALVLLKGRMTRWLHTTAADVHSHTATKLSQRH